MIYGLESRRAADQEAALRIAQGPALDFDYCKVFASEAAQQIGK